MDAELRSMVMAFRVAELQALLGFAGKNKSGRKNELQARCLEMCKSRSAPIIQKIKDLYRSIQISNYSQPYTGVTSGLSYTTGPTAALTRSASYSDGKYGQDNAFGKNIGYQRVIGGDGQCRTVPICPDVKLKELPFYDIQAVLVRPTSLINSAQAPKQETQQQFCLSPSQAAEISSSREVVVTEGSAGFPISKVQYSVQVQLRFCALDSTGEQDDLFPPNLVVKVNGRPVQLPQPIPSNRPGVEPKRPSKPLNITNNVKCCPHSTNIIHVQWVTDNTRNYAMSVYMVKRLSAEDLFQRLKSKRIQPADFTRGRIKEITTSEEEDLCAPTSIRVSVACPLGKSRMSYPCRATTCKHLQCFDANLFLMMNEKKPTFICPVCNTHLKFGDLSIDGYFMDVIQKLSFDAENEIELFPDGHWEPVRKIKTEPADEPPTKRMKADTTTTNATSLNETIDLDDDICIVEEDVKPTTGQLTSASKTSNNDDKPEVEVIDILSSDDEDDDAPAAVQNVIPESTNPVNTVEDEPQLQQGAQEEEDDDDEEEIGIRPRRRKPRINYVEESSSDSSTNDGNTTTAPTAPSGGRSPACIELSDSAPSSPEVGSNQKRAFSSVSAASSRPSSTSSHTNRSGSGTSTLYSSSAPPVNRTGVGNDNVPNNPPDAMMVRPEAMTSNFPIMNTPQTSSQYSSSDMFSANAHTTTPSILSASSSTSTASSLYYSSQQTQYPGYPAYPSTTTNWQSDLNSFINPPAVGSGQMDLSSTFDFGFFNTPNFLGYDPRSAPGGGGGFGSWM